MEDIQARIIEAIEPLIKDNFMELVDLEVSQGCNIRVRIGRPGGSVSLDDCSFISRKISEMCGIEEIAAGDYSLEVSSPGINRPLKKIEDFGRFAGKKAKIVTREKIDGETVFLGFIKAVEGRDVVMDRNGSEIRINIEIIKKARLEELI